MFFRFAPPVWLQWAAPTLCLGMCAVMGYLLTLTTCFK